MGHYYGNVDYESILSSMRQYYARYPLELQLTWLVEMLILQVFIVLRSSNSNRLQYDVDEDKYTVYQYTVKRYLQFVGFSADVINKLFYFRNKYVHEGPCAAKSILYELKYSYPLELIELSRFVDVNPNLNVTLYKLVEGEDV